MESAYGMQTFYTDQMYYYIHRRYEHFEEAGDLLQTLTEQKETFYNETLKRFKENYIASISPESLEPLRLAMENEDEIIETIDKALGEQLNSTVSKALQESRLEGMIKDAYSALDKVVKNRDAENLENLFAVIEEAATMLEDSEMKNALLAILQNRKNYSQLGRFANYINKEISKMDMKILETNYSTISTVLNSLQKLTRRLVNKEKKSVLQGSIKNIFSTAFGEYAVQKAVGNLMGNLKQSIEEGLLGAGDVKLEHPDVVKTWERYGSQSPRHKVDNYFKHFNIQIDETNNSVFIDLGISTKWYKTGGDAQGVAFTTEKSFKHRLDQIFNNQNMYGIYNGLALTEQDPSIYHALKAVIVARNIDTMMSGLGVAAGDFAQFIVINGHFYSIYDIIKTLENYNTGQGTDIVTVSAKGLKQVLDYTKAAQNENKNLEAAFERSKQQNKLLDVLELTGHFYPQRLISVVK